MKMEVWVFNHKLLVDCEIIDVVIELVVGGQSANVADLADFCLEFFDV